MSRAGCTALAHRANAMKRTAIRRAKSTSTDVVTHHASAHQKGNGDADVSRREKPAESALAAVGQVAIARNQRSVRINTRSEGLRAQLIAGLSSHSRHEHRSRSALAPDAACACAASSPKHPSADPERCPACGMTLEIRHVGSCRETPCSDRQGGRTCHVQRRCLRWSASVSDGRRSTAHDYTIMRHVAQRPQMVARRIPWPLVG
jgi:hypothetical protein